MSTWRRRAAIAAGIAVGCTVLFALSAPARIFRAHTDHNHFALLAEGWLAGRLDLGGAPPDHTGGNDFAVFGDPREGERVFVSFPPFPALILLPFVAWAGSAGAVRDGLVFLLLAGLGPGALFLALERLRDLGRSAHGERTSAALAGLFALGTVYWSTAVQGSVWFAAHVVGVACAAGSLACGLGAARPAWAGLCLGLGVATRTPLLFAAPLFVWEAWLRGRAEAAPDGAPRVLGVALAPFARRVAAFAAPLAIVLAALAWHNHARFGDPLEFGHRHLAVVWQDRIQRWGLFSPHYLGKNLAVALAATPWWGGEGAPLRIGGHGLALWITSPFLLWLAAPRGARRQRLAAIGLAATAAIVLLPSLLYQNTGWIQFGYRFSNDAAPFAILLLASVRPRLSAGFWAAAAISVGVNAFGALTFQRPEGARYYVRGPAQHAIFEPD